MWLRPPSLHKQVTPKCGTFQTFILQVHSCRGGLEPEQVGRLRGAWRTACTEGRAPTGGRRCPRSIWGTHPPRCACAPRGRGPGDWLAVGGGGGGVVQGLSAFRMWPRVSTGSGKVSILDDGVLNGAEHRICPFCYRWVERWWRVYTPSPSPRVGLTLSRPSPPPVAVVRIHGALGGWREGGGHGCSRPESHSRLREPCPAQDVLWAQPTEGFGTSPEPQGPWA